MEFLTGVLQKETMEISDLVRPGLEGSEVKVNGAIHTIRDMGPIAFVILRKREGLLQCVYEPGAADFTLKDLKEADTIEVSGTLALSEKAPSGIEVRMKSVRILSEPTEAMPIPVSKWKMNVSLETNPYSVATRKLSCCRKRPRRPEGWPPYDMPIHTITT